MLAALALGISTPATSQTLSVELEVPRLTVAEYHRPYIALWVATDANAVAANLAVLYDVDMEDKEGEKWLKDMRQWWRRSGRSLSMPVDGISGATRGPGSHSFNFSDQAAQLEAGNYRLMIEVVREVGGRELLEIPFQWPPVTAQSASASGAEELGLITLNATP